MPTLNPSKRLTMNYYSQLIQKKCSTVVKESIIWIPGWKILRT